MSNRLPEMKALNPVSVAGTRNGPSSHPLIMSHYLRNHIVKEAVLYVPEEEAALTISCDLLALLLGCLPDI